MRITAAFACENLIQNPDLELTYIGQPVDRTEVPFLPLSGVSIFVVVHCVLEHGEGVGAQEIRCIATDHRGQTL